MEFFNEAVRVLETLAKALNGDFAPDLKSCHKRSFGATALPMAALMPWVQALCVTESTSARPSVPSPPERISRTRNPSTTTNFFLKSGGIYYGFL